jgi:hypothetical protein
LRPRPEPGQAARADREATRDRLTAANLARLNAPDLETFSDDARFALDSNVVRFVIAPQQPIASVILKLFGGLDITAQ